MLNFAFSIVQDQVNWVQFGGQFVYVLIYVGVTWKMVKMMEANYQELKKESKKK